MSPSEFEVEAYRNQLNLGDSRMQRALVVTGSEIPEDHNQLNDGDSPERSQLPAVGSEIQNAAQDSHLNSRHLLEHFQPLSAAVEILAKGMWGSFEAAREVMRVKRDDRAANLAFGPWRTTAAQRLWQGGVLKGDLAVYVTQRHGDPVQLPVEVAAKLIMPLHGLSDLAIRPTRNLIRDERLRTLLLTGQLVVGKTEFEIWYRTDRAKRTWPSQRSCKKRRIGRPTRPAENVTAAITRLADDGQWDGSQPLAKLHRQLLEDFPDMRIPSRDTLARIIKRMVIEGGDIRLHLRR